MSGLADQNPSKRPKAEDRLTCHQCRRVGTTVELYDRKCERRGRCVLIAARKQTGSNLIEKRDKFRNALIEVHEYHCGCDHPGDLTRCVSQPVVVFEVLRDE